MNLFEIGYLIPSFIRQISSPQNSSTRFPPSSLLGSLVKRTVDEHNSAATTLGTASSTPNLIFVNLYVSNSTRLFAIIVCAILITPLIQLCLGCSRWKFHRKQPPSPRRIRSTKCLIIFKLIWLLTSMLLLSIVIFYAEHLDLFGSRQNNVTSVVSHAESVTTRSVSLIHLMTEESFSLVNNFTTVIAEDLYATVLNEVPNITNQFLQLTDLDTPLGMLGDLAQLVDDLLDAHIFLRENGPQVALEFDKLDSNVKINAQFLASEVSSVRALCGNSFSLSPVFDQFEQVVFNLTRGLHDSPSSKETFFRLFRLESSLGLFNMLNVLPFNVSEVTGQLRTAIAVRGDLEQSIRNKTVNYFSTLTGGTPNAWLRPHMAKALCSLDRSALSFHELITKIEPEFEDVFSYRSVVYVVGLVSLSLPIALLVRASLYPSIKTNSKESAPLLLLSSSSASSSSPGTEVNSNGSSPTRKLSIEGIGSELKQQVGMIESATVLSEISTISGSPSSNQKLLAVVKAEEGHTLRKHNLKSRWQTRSMPDIETKIATHRVRCLQTCACHITCCSLFFVSLISVVLFFIVGSFQLQVCFPLLDEVHQRNLDGELNAIIDNNWESWITQLDSTLSNLILPSVSSNSNSSNSNFTFSQFLHIDRPRDLVSSLFTRCQSTADNQSLPNESNGVGSGSLFDAISFSLTVNLAGLLRIPVLQAQSETFKLSFVDQAVDLMLEKLSIGLLPSNFELLLQKLKEDQAHALDNSTIPGLDADDKALLEDINRIPQNPTGGEDGGILDTVNRFWSQSIEGAAKREEAMLSAMARFRQNRQLLKQLLTIRQRVEWELMHQEQPLTIHCSGRLQNLIQVSHYGLQIIRSSRKAFEFKTRIETLLTAAKTLRVISTRPTFTNTLTSFADTAFAMGLSRSSPKEGRNELLDRVKRATEMEYDRLAEIIQGPVGSEILNRGIKQLLSNLASPCSLLGNMAKEVVGTVCPLNNAPGHRLAFVPLLLRLSTLTIVLILFAFISQIQFDLYTSIVHFLRFFHHRTTPSHETMSGC